MDMGIVLVLTLMVMMLKKRIMVMKVTMVNMKMMVVKMLPAQSEVDQVFGLLSIQPLVC